jgi:hypothetical protein
MKEGVGFQLAGKTGPCYPPATFISDKSEDKYNENFY